MADYIDRNKIIYRDRYGAHNNEGLSNYVFESDIDKLPSVDAVEVVRCKDCKHRYYDFCKKFMQKTEMGIKGHLVKDTDYCKWGEKE